MTRSPLTRLALPLSVIAVASFACDSSVTPSTGGSGGASTGATMQTTGSSSPTSSSSGAGGGEQFSVKFDPITVPPGTEKTQCVVRKLSNPAAAHVGQIHNVLGEGSHHLIVYRTADTVEQTTPFDCQPFSDLLKPEKGTPLMISQKQDDLLTLPQGVAFSIAKEQFVRLEMHYINATAAPLEVTATTTFITMEEKDFQNEADFLFFGNPDIDLAPNAKATLGPTYLPLPATLAGSKFFGFAGHTHQWGTNVYVGTTTGKTGPDTDVYKVDNWQWAEPATVYWDPPVEVPQNGGFHLTCEWENGSPNNVQFGESANDEMCFFWTYYYPSKGAFVCAHTDKFGGYDLCCPGNALCSQLFP
ncbi:MAG: hypothetical protein U0414_18250 [Polyangiaceae bacterium]